MSKRKLEEEEEEVEKQQRDGVDQAMVIDCGGQEKKRALETVMMEAGAREGANSLTKSQRSKVGASTKGRRLLGTSPAWHTETTRKRNPWESRCSPTLTEALAEAPWSYAPSGWTQSPS